MKIVKISMLAILLSTTALMANAGCPITETVGTPTSQSDSSYIPLCRIGYETYYNPSTKTPKWVEEYLVRENVVGPEHRSNNFRPDPDLPRGIRSELSDYKGSGYARGHMAPAGDFRKNSDAMTQSFYLSNMVPQIQNCNNAGIWSKIEDMTRDWAVHYGELHVVTGPIYKADNGTIGNGVAIPTHLFKVIYNPSLKETLTFVVENKELCDITPKDVLSNQSNVESLTGLVLFPKISNYVQSPKIWQ